MRIPSVCLRDSTWTGNKSDGTVIFTGLDLLFGLAVARQLQPAVSRSPVQLRKWLPGLCRAQLHLTWEEERRYMSIRCGEDDGRVDT